MSLNVGKEVAVLERMTVRELKERYAELFGEETRTHNRAWLFKRIAWRIQSQAEGDLSERAKQRAAELACDADLRLSPPKVDQPARVAVGPTVSGPLAISPNDRLPVPGTIITREYRGETWQVQVLPNGFEFEGETYKSLSAVAKKITGQHLNGYHFFRLPKKGGER